MIKKLAHVCFIVSDLKKSLDFYCNKIGLKHAFNLTRGAYMKICEGNFVEIFQGTPSKEKGYTPHFCIEVEGLESMVENLRKNGVTVTDTKMGEDNSYQAWVTDPDGYMFELHEYTPESLQKK